MVEDTTFISTREYKFRISKRSSNFLFYYVKCSQYITTFAAIFRRFPTTFRRFFQNCSKGQTERFRTFSEDFRTFSEDCEDDRRRSENVSIMHPQVSVVKRTFLRISYRFHRFVTTIVRGIPVL